MRLLGPSTVLFVCLLFQPVATRAQSPDGSSDPQQPAAGTPAAPPPPAAPADTDPKALHGELTAGFQVLTGVNEAWGSSFDGNVAKPYSDRGKFVARATYNYAKVTVQDEPLIEKIQSDRLLLSAGVDQSFSTHGVFMARTVFLRDTVQEIPQRYEETVGAGYHVLNKERGLEFSLVPDLSAVHQETYLGNDTGWQAGLGVHEQFAWKFTGAWSVENLFNYSHNYGDGGSDSIESNASLTGALKKGL